MDEEILGRRRQALEEAFFRKQNEGLVERLRKEQHASETREGLAGVTGIRDEAVLDKLASAGITASSLTAFRLVPLIHVAWADGHLDPKERDAILAAASGAGIETGSPAYELLDAWLRRRPEAELFDSWRAYVRELSDELESGAGQALRSDALDLVDRVARAAGGVLGVGKVSDAEKGAIAEIEAAFAARGS